MKIYRRVVGESRRRKRRRLAVSLLILSIILTISVWIIAEALNANHLVAGFPWEQMGRGELVSLVALFILSFSTSSIYVVYYKGVREVAEATPRYLLAILAVVILARLLFRF